MTAAPQLELFAASTELLRPRVRPGFVIRPRRPKPGTAPDDGKPFDDPIDDIGI